MVDQHAAKQCAGCRHFVPQCSMPNPNNTRQKMVLGDCRHPSNDAKIWGAPYGFERSGTNRCSLWEKK